MITSSPTAQIVFIANHIPPLKDGSYSLKLTQTLSYGEGTQNIFSKSHNFAVAGDRFSLTPKYIHKLFPPANTQGTYDNVLPHVVLTRRTLPWERFVNNGDNTASWLAILLFPETAAPTIQNLTLADLYPASAPDGGGLLPTNIYSYGSAIPATDYFLSYGEKSSDSCVCIDISPDLFSALAPSLNDLQWNAHARTKIKEDAVTEDYAVVVGNCPPIPGMNNIAHLVSLEGLGEQLPQDDGTFARAPTWDKIRLVSLQSWKFHVNPLEASFTDILCGLNGGINTTWNELGDSQLRLPIGYFPSTLPTGQPAAPFDSGYTVLAEQEQTYNTSWYRGPFVPSTITPPAASNSWSDGLLPATSASALNMPVSTTPANDKSYAAAWQLGRLLALADKDFAIAQVSWKRDCRLALNTLLAQTNQQAGGSRAAYAQMMREVLADAGKIQKVLGNTLTTQVGNALFIPQSLVDWLAGLALLSNIPFHYFVPDMKMLPTESLRFFNVDPRWLACLLDGAWSLDRQPSSQWAFDTAYQPWQQLMNGTLTPSFAPGKNIWPISGAFLNSILIPGYWPGIEFSTTPASNLLNEQFLSPSTLLLLFDQSFTRLTIQQPPEGIHFGFNISETGQITKPLRYVYIDNVCYPTPPPAPPPPPSSGDMTSSTSLSNLPQRVSGVIQFDLLAKAMMTALGITDTSLFSPAEFALELVESVSASIFQLPPTS